ncbi:hypothetical protein [Pseudomonas agarici]|uniref:hypothetical protein n=1 Tax=Pseudomonas agarici TaxID=46677 RepID=UPI00115FFFAE|nr:hypothetical protein [Pseudomonas agarici]NWB93820.1 hypothetical protein [Pseudomonas agarici]NWC09948.1 hypothetical protein [Pseudomonas agarici]
MMIFMGSTLRFLWRPCGPPEQVRQRQGGRDSLGDPPYSCSAKDHNGATVYGLWGEVFLEPIRSIASFTSIDWFFCHPPRSDVDIRFSEYLAAISPATLSDTGKLFEGLLNIGLLVSD